MGLLECAPRATALRTERIFLTMALLDDAEATRKTATVCVHQRRLTPTATLKEAVTTTDRSYERWTDPRQQYDSWRVYNRRPGQDRDACISVHNTPFSTMRRRLGKAHRSKDIRLRTLRCLST